MRGAERGSGSLVNRSEAEARHPIKDVATMSEISNIGITPSYPTTYGYSGTQAAPQSEPASRAEALGETDPVEFSRLGRLLAGDGDLSSLRAAKLRAIRAQIEEGTYETPQRINGTVDRLMAILGS